MHTYAIYVYICIHMHVTMYGCYGVATIRRLLKITGLFCRI